MSVSPTRPQTNRFKRPYHQHHHQHHHTTAIPHQLNSTESIRKRPFSLEDPIDYQHTQRPEFGVTLTSTPISESMRFITPIGLQSVPCSNLNQVLAGSCPLMGGLDTTLYEIMPDNTKVNMLAMMHSYCGMMTMWLLLPPINDNVRVA